MTCHGLAAAFDSRADVDSVHRRMANGWVVIFCTSGLSLGTRMVVTWLLAPWTSVSGLRRQSQWLGVTCLERAAVGNGRVRSA